MTSIKPEDRNCRLSNEWTPYFNPPTIRAQPNPTSKLTIIEPVRDAFTTRPRPFRNATIPIINSGALLKVELRRPPTTEPRR